MDLTAEEAISKAKIKLLLEEILFELGYNWEEDENLKDTPRRVTELWWKELRNNKEDRSKITVFPEKHSSMIMVIGHTVWTRCPHHLERVKMKVSIGYLQGKEELVIGVSKLPRLADFFAKGMILQETYTDRLANELLLNLNAAGVGVHVVGQHHCMCARGVETDGLMVTTALKGNFLEADIKNEFLREVHTKPWGV